MTQIEIDLSKLERGLREGRVKVTRGGKTFWRKQRVGVKEEEKKVSPEIDDNLVEFKKSLEGKSVDECISIIEGVFKSNKILTGVFDAWYAGSVRMTLVERIANSIFELSDSTARPRPFFPPSATKLENNFNEDNANTQDFLKSYYANQKLLENEHPDGFIEIYRGVGGNTIKEFDSKSVGEKVDLDCYNLSSWTDDREVAVKFGKSENGVVIKSKIPIQRILIQYKGNRSGSYLEKEVVVIGNSIKGEIDKVFRVD